VFSVIVRELIYARTTHGNRNLPCPRRVLEYRVVLGDSPSYLAAGRFAATIKS
jgi:hypothetical protein